MYISQYTSQNFTPLQTIFGSGYVPEQHGDEAPRYLPAAEKCEHVLNFDELLKALRFALSLR
jgi:hypothetical protein